MPNEAAIIGASASQYQGNPELGGYGFGYGKIDTKPLEDLSKYTFIYNQAEWEKKQKDAEKAANEIADVTSYDLTASIKKDSDQLQDEWGKVIDYIKKNPDAVDYNKNKEGWLEYQRMKGNLLNDINGAKKRSILYDVRNKEIADTTSPQLKSYLKNSLDSEANNTGIRQPLSFTAKYDLSPVEVKAAPIRKFSVTDVGKNIIGEASWDIPDMNWINNQATSLATGLDKLTNFESDPNYINASPDVKQRMKEQFLSQQASGKLEPVQSAQYFNSALGRLPDDYYNVDAAGNKTLNFDKLKNSNNPILAGVAGQVDLYNQQMDNMQKWIRAGYFKDDFGRELHFGNDATGLKESDYKKIDLNKGITPEDLLKIRILGVTPTPERTMKTTDTGFGIREGTLAEDIRHHKVMEGIDWDKFKLEKSKYGDAMIGADSVLRQISDALNNAPFGTISGGGEKDQTIKEISDPLLLKEFANLDKSGSQTRRPDTILYGLDNNKLSLVYYKSDEKDQYGRPIIEKQIDLDPSEWMGMLVSRKFKGSEEGAINELVDRVYNQYGRNLIKLADSYKGGATATKGQPSETESVSGATKTKTKYPLPKGQAKQVTQNGYTYTWNEDTGQYE